MTRSRRQGVPAHAIPSRGGSVSMGAARRPVHEEEPPGCPRAQNGGAEAGDRTRTRLPSTVFETVASACSATSACVIRAQHRSCGGHQWPPAAVRGPQGGVHVGSTPRPVASPQAGAQEGRDGAGAGITPAIVHRRGRGIGLGRPRGSGHLGPPGATGWCRIAPQASPACCATQPGTRVCILGCEESPAGVDRLDRRVRRSRPRTWRHTGRRW